MARKASGADQLEATKALLKQAKTAEELRAAQAIVLTLALGLSLAQTAATIGRSMGATCTMRTRFGRVLGGEKKALRSKRELRNRAKASLDRCILPRGNVYPLTRPPRRDWGALCGEILAECVFGLCRQGFAFKRIAAARTCGSEAKTGKANRASGWRGL